MCKSHRDSVKTFIVQDLTVSIVYDTDCPGPREWDNLGRMICTHRHYNLGDEQIKTEDFSSWARVEASLNAHISLPLYLYDHRGITISTMPFNDHWDSGQVGWVYVTADDLRKEFGVQHITPEIEEKARGILIGEVEDIGKEPGRLYKYAIVRPAQDMTKLEEVMCIK